ncbi:ATP-dependent DNA ligase [Actinoplanes sp. URMC 104]|uniref:ATP-dependent DNA ligase n=1 Tax=Actinoplanes sp. URMC 104 TaxID=3423409 RepID=UPI003F1C3205
MATAAARPVAEGIASMLAAGGDLPAGPGWVYEFKYDGVRALTYAGAGVRVFSRNGNDITRTYPELAECATRLVGRCAVLDGEIVALEHDRLTFARLQQRMHVSAPAPSLVAAVPVRYYVFDLLGLDGQDLTARPYAQRRDLLAGLRLSAST